MGHVRAKSPCRIFTHQNSPCEPTPAVDDLPDRFGIVCELELTSRTLRAGVVKITAVAGAGSCAQNAHPHAELKRNASRRSHHLLVGIQRARHGIPLRHI